MGKRNLERALATAKPRAKDVEFKTIWRPFFLMPPRVWQRGIAAGDFPEDAEETEVEDVGDSVSIPVTLYALPGVVRI